MSHRLAPGTARSQSKDLRDLVATYSILKAQQTHFGTELFKDLFANKTILQSIIKLTGSHCRDKKLM